MRPDRRARERFGRRAEWLAALWLQLKGYRVLGRRMRNPFGEIDIVCRRGDTLVFVEVKARADRDTALLSLRAGQQQRIVAAAVWYLKQRPHLADLYCRFDLVTIDRYGLPHHLTDIWQGRGHGRR